ncbi:sensor histidine kinase [Paenibacillus alkaliterrae]|uniref:sensor histidine kinase n=1 Tax=Paenibacillus alkaliterrae TaxID=320909 RepID=UPI001F4581FA|nr:sensor histidine kinase [Paenibacillus alkaliterrae]MCF2941705.1 sensor histidine kinase [Paenibacillus alkaliterrae]
MAFRSLLRFLWSKSIIRNMLFSYLGINLILLFLLGLVSIRDSTSTLTKEIIASRYKVMEQAARGINFNVEEAKRPLVQFASHSSVIALMNPNSAITLEERIQHERSIAELSKGVTALQSLISDVLMLGTNGYVNNLDNRKSLQWDYPFREQEWYLKAVSASTNRGFIPLFLHQQNYYTQTMISKFNSQTFSIALPVKGYSQQVIGTVIANLDLQKVNDLFELSATDQDGENIFMIDGQNTVIVHPDAARIGGSIRFEGIEAIHAAESGSFVSTIEGQERLVVYHPTSIKGLRLVSTVPMSEIHAQAGPLKATLAGLLYLCLLLNTLISIIITIRISRPFSRLLVTIDKLGEESLYVVPKNYKYRELNLIGNKFKELVGRIEQLVKQNYVSQIALQDAQLKTLESQINPHFLFNTLQLLQTEIVCGNTDDSNHMVLSLSGLLRYSMKRDEERVELAAEIQNAKDYLYIINKKYDDGIRITFDVEDAALLRSGTVKLMLQPIIENAIVHAFRENPQSACIRIKVAAVRRGLCISVSDNGVGMTKERRQWLTRRLTAAGDSTGSIGLNNVDRRIKLTFGPAYGLRVRSRHLEGTTVYIVLPGLS